MCGWAGEETLTSIVMASTSCLFPLFLLDFSFWSLDCFGEDVDGASETIETSPFVSAAPVAEAVDLRGMFELCKNLSHKGTMKGSD